MVKLVLKPEAKLVPELVAELVPEPVAALVPEPKRCSCLEKPNLEQPKMKPYQRPPNYTHLGSGATLTELQEKFQTCFSPIQKPAIGLYKLILCDNPIMQSCTPYSCTFEKPASEKVTVFYRIGYCAAHKYLVICILHQGALRGPKLDDLKNIVFQEITPQIQYPIRGSTDKRKNEEGFLCHCNLDGGTKTFGCTKCIVNPKVCKFYYFPGEELGRIGRQKFRLKGKLNNATVKSLCETVCDMATIFVKNWAPQCYKNMADLSLAANDCRIGTKPINLFAAVTFVADYTAHSHLDEHDYAGGATVILSLRKNPGAPAQLHYLPMYRLSGSVGPGVAFDLSDGSLFMECAAMETHGSSPVLNASKNAPERVGIVCFTHSSLNKPNHGKYEKPKPNKGENQTRKPEPT